MEHGWDDAGGAVGGRRDHPAPHRVLLVDGNGVDVDPIHDIQRVLEVGLRVLHQLAVDLGCAAAHLHPARQDAVGQAAPAHALLHDVPDLEQPGPHLGFRAPGLFVLQHDLADGLVVAFAEVEQLVAGVEGVGQDGVIVLDAFVARGRVVHHEAAAHGVVDAVVQRCAGCVAGDEAHAIGVIGERGALEEQLLFLDKGNGVAGQQAQLLGGANGEEARLDALDLHLVRLLAFQAEQDRLVGAVALARGAQGAVELDSGRPRCGAAGPAGGGPGRNRRAAFIGPTVWELEGPMPILKRSKTLMAIDTCSSCTHSSTSRRQTCTPCSISWALTHSSGLWMACMPVKRFGVGTPISVSWEPSVPPRTGVLMGVMPSSRMASSASSRGACRFPASSACCDIGA